VAEPKETRKQMSDDIKLVVVMLKAHNDFLKALLAVPSIPIPFEQHSKFMEDLDAIHKMIDEIISQ